MDVNSLTAHADEARRLSKEQQAILDEILAPEPLIAGSVSQILRRCGKPNCHCVERPSHPTTHLKTSQDGHARCQLVRKADEAEVIDKVNRYRRAKTLLRKLSTLERRRREALQAAIEARRETYS